MILLGVSKTGSGPKGERRSSANRLDRRSDLVRCAVRVATDSAVSPTGDDDGRDVCDIDWKARHSHRCHPHQICGLGEIAGN
jgi:hypothetical protein